jgi:hypothetical protein
MPARRFPLISSLFLFSSVVWLALSPAPLRAREEEPPVPGTSESAPAKGFFLSVSARSLAFRGDFDGKLVLWHFEKAFFAPRLDPATGLGVGFGVKHDGWLWEMGYVQSGHGAALPGRTTRATYRSLEMNGKSFLFRDLFFHPYIALGISVPWLTVRDGSEFRGARTDAAYIGIGLNLGAGVLADISPRVFISGGVGWRVLGYYYASGEGKGRDITELRVGYEGPVWGNWLRTSTFEVSFGLGLIL